MPLFIITATRYLITSPSLPLFSPTPDPLHAHRKRSGEREPPSGGEVNLERLISTSLLPPYLCILLEHCSLSLSIPSVLNQFEPFPELVWLKLAGLLHEVSAITNRREIKIGGKQACIYADTRLHTLAERA